ncbi:Putative thiazole biosynthetic enzyme [archaeon HR01]|nr:Putative thiazole biosynthetic enzyme [archaeon HR01]
MRPRADAAVVGAGPAGLMAAAYLAFRGFDVVVFEEDAIIGRPERCAGLYSLWGLKALRIPADGPYLQNRVMGAVFTSPSGESFTVKAPSEVAVVCNRERFDQYLAEKALDNGATIYLGVHVRDIHRRDGGYVLDTGAGQVEASYLLVAEGRKAHIARRIYPGYRLGPWIPIIQYQVAGHGQDPDLVYLYFTRYLPDFFAYLVPVDGDVGKLGVAAVKNTWALSLRFLREYFPGARILGVSSSSVYVGPPLPDPKIGNAFLLGDVAGQVKATTGGGVVYGGLYALAAARHIAGMADFYSTVKPLQRELENTYLLRRLVSRIGPAMLDTLFRSVGESGMAERLGRLGNMERHHNTLLRSLLHPSATLLALHLIKNYLQAILKS